MNKGNKKLIQLFIAFLFWSHATNVGAISLNKTQYYSDEPIYLNSNGGPWVIYNITKDIPVGGMGSHDEGDDIGFGFSGQENNNFSIIETISDGLCEGTDDSPALTYMECKNLPDFVGEFTFTVLSRPLSSAPPPEPEVSGGGGGPTAYRPEVSIYSPLDGKLYGTNIEIIYEATDKNDELGQRHLGLGVMPVTIFFSKTADTRQRVQLGTSLPEKGVFKWNTKDLPEGDSYNVIISAIDKVGEVGESVSGNFIIDHTAPVFTVKTDPTITRGEDVKIFVESSKELPNPPIVRVTQNEFNSFPVSMTGSGTTFEGVYTVVGGYDGPAKIEVTGKDLAGNESNLIVSGGQFSVGILPPPKPVILSPLDRDIAPSGTIEVRGKARKDTEVMLSLNGVEKFSKNPDTNGEFVFSNLKLRPDFNFGNNVISIISIDAAGNISESADLVLKFNIAPEIFIESPVKGETLGATTQVTVGASDKNKDRLNFKYEISKDAGLNWTNLNIPKERRSFSWDTTIYEDGDYLMRVTVSDGTSEKVATVEGLIIKNLLPTFSFDDGPRTVTNKKEITLSGTVTSSTKIPLRPKLMSVEYSLNKGESWSDAVIVSGVNTPEIKFNIPLSFSEEGTRQLMLRSRDDRDIYGRGVKSIIVIFEPPTIPAITSPKDGIIVDNSMDRDKFEAGVQISITGSSKANVSINVRLDDKMFYGKTDSTGKFSVNNVAIRKHGQNVIEIFAEDEAGNKSGVNKLNVVYNNPPTLSFLNPRASRGLSHKTDIEFTVFDPDGDEIKTTTLSLKKPGENSFSVLDKNTPENKFEIDVSNFAEGGGYELRLDSTDGVSSASKTISFFVDNTNPTIFMESIPNKNFKKDFRFEATGFAEDGLSGIEFVEYSLDEEHWFKALITRGFLSKRASFRIRHPFTLDDGIYNIKFRSVDASGNLSNVWSEQFVVDTMPPRMGSFELLHNNISMYPDEDGFNIMMGKKIVLRASFEIDTKSVSMVIGDSDIVMNRTTAGIWEGEFTVGEIGSFDLEFSAKDSFGNEVLNKKIGNINVLKSGIIREMSDADAPMGDLIEDVEIGVYIFSEDRQRFERWPGEYYGIENPTKSISDGSYSLFLPPGKYQIYIEKSGFVKVKTNEFSLPSGKFINFDFSLKRREGVRGFVEDILEKIMIF